MSSTSAMRPGPNIDETMDYEVDPDPPSVNEKTASCEQAARILLLEAENKRLAEQLLMQKESSVYFNEKCRTLQEALDKEVFTAKNLSEKQLNYFTGVRSSKLFNWIVEVVSAHQLPSFCKKLSITDKVLLILMKLRLGLQNKDLAYR
uniref:Transposase Helix-turn-helix domain-containing protein n=1 Tax=Knipowitschia caucasica TaxID=637954 RepID=A0AAV2MIA7_KNICA